MGSIAITFAAAATTLAGTALAHHAIVHPLDLNWNEYRESVVQVAMLTMGYIVTIAWLPSRNGRTPTARAHALAGLTAPVVSMAIATQAPFLDLVYTAAICFTAGSLTAGMQWSRSLRPPRRRKPTIEELENAADAALAHALASGSTGADAIPMPRPRPEHLEPRARVA